MDCRYCNLLFVFCFGLAILPFGLKGREVLFSPNTAPHQMLYLPDPRCVLARCCSRPVRSSPDAVLARSKVCSRKNVFARCCSPSIVAGDYSNLCFTGTVSQPIFLAVLVIPASHLRPSPPSSTLVLGFLSSLITRNVDRRVRRIDSDRSILQAWLVGWAPCVGPPMCSVAALCLPGPAHWIFEWIIAWLFGGLAVLLLPDFLCCGWSWVGLGRASISLSIVSLWDRWSGMVFHNLSVVRLATAFVLSFCGDLSYPPVGFSTMDSFMFNPYLFCCRFSIPAHRLVIRAVSALGFFVMIWLALEDE